MSYAMKGACMGAALAFMAMIFILLFRVRSPLGIWLLWPTRVLDRLTEGSGTIWMILFETIAFFSNAALYGLVGFGLGKLIDGRTVKA